MPLSTYPSAVKLVWLLRNVESVRKAYEEGRLVFGTMDSWLLWCLNGKGKIGSNAEGKEEAERRGLHVTDVTNASRTMFVDLETLKYKDEVFDFFEIERGKVRWPRIVPNSDDEVSGCTFSSCLCDVFVQVYWLHCRTSLLLSLNFDDNSIAAALRKKVCFREHCLCLPLPLWPLFALFWKKIDVEVYHHTIFCGQWISNVPLYWTEAIHTLCIFRTICHPLKCNGMYTGNILLFF